MHTAGGVAVNFL